MKFYGATRTSMSFCAVLYWYCCFSPNYFFGQVQFSVLFLMIVVCIYLLFRQLSHSQLKEACHFVDRKRQVVSVTEVSFFLSEMFVESLCETLISVELVPFLLLLLCCRRKECLFKGWFVDSDMVDVDDDTVFSGGRTIW